MKNKTTRLAAGALLAFVLTTLVSCSSSDSSADTTVAASDSTEAPATPVITVSGQWARTSPMATDMGAAYMTINSDANDTLEGVMVDMSVAKMAQVHETVEVDGAMKMQEVDHVDVVAGTPLELKSGGYHVMLMNLVSPLKTGTNITLTLKFTKAGEVEVTVPVLEEAP